MQVHDLIEQELDDARRDLERVRTQLVEAARSLVVELENATRAVEAGRHVNSLGICQSRSQTIDRLAALHEAGLERLATAERIAKQSAKVSA